MRARREFFCVIGGKQIGCRRGAVKIQWSQSWRAILLLRTRDGTGSATDPAKARPRGRAFALGDRPLVPGFGTSGLSPVLVEWRRQEFRQPLRALRIRRERG